MTFEAGDLWEKVLRDSISKCERVLVFGSLAARASLWVTREWLLALELKKRIVPVPLDDTPLPLKLAQFQAMPELKNIIFSSMQTFSADTFAEVEKAKPYRPPADAARGIRRPTIASGLAVVVLLLLTAWAISIPNSIIRVFELVKSVVLWSPWLWLTLFISAVVAMCAPFLLKRSRRAFPRLEIPESPAKPTVADSLERAELGDKFVKTLFTEP